MSPLATLVTAPTDVRAAALALLDEISEPLDKRRLERALQDGGLTRRAARQAMHALRNVEVIALIRR